MADLRDVKKKAGELRKALRKLEELTGEHGRWMAADHMEVAEFFDVKLDTVKNWAKQKMPGTKGAWPLDKICQWLYTVGPRRPRSENPEQPTADDRRREFQALTAETNYKERIGQLLPYKDVAMIVDEAMATVGDLAEILRRELSDHTIEDFNAAVLSARSRVYERLANNNRVVDPRQS